MKQKFTQLTKPGETYIRLGHMIKKMAPGERMPPFNKLLKLLGITQRSLDMAYGQLKEEGVLDIKNQSGVYIKNPYAGGSFLFVGAEDVFLSHIGGENIRLYFAELRRKVHHYFPGSSLEVILTESPDKEYYDREPQLRKLLSQQSKLTRVLGAFVSYNIVEEQTIRDFHALDIPFVDLNGNCLKVNDCFHDIKTMVSYLRQNGMKRIFVISSFPKDPELKNYITADADIEIHSFDSQNDDMVKAGIEYIKTLIDSGKMPDAFVVHDDYFCQGILLGAYIRGVKLEDEYGLITVSQQGVPIYANNSFPRLNYQWDTIADAASKIMLKKLEKEKNVSIAVLPVLEFSQ